MSAVDISLFDLLNVSIGTPEVGAVNFNALYSLLHAILGHLKIQNVTTHWREENHPPQEPRSQSQSKAPLRELPGPYHHMEDKLRKIELKMSALDKLPNGPELMNMCRSESSATPVSDMWQQIQIRRQVQANEDGVSKAMALIQDLLREIQDLKELRDSMKEEIMNLQERLDQMHMDKVSTSLEDVEKCCHRVDNLETVMRHLGERVSQFPAPGELEQCVTWDIMQSTLVNERQTRENEVPDSPQMPCPQPPAPPSTRPTLPTSTTATTISLPTTPRSPTTSTPTSTKPDASRNAPPETAPEAGAASPQRSLSDCAVVPLSRVSSGAERYPETVHALRVVGRLGEKQDHLEARVERLEAGVERLEAGAEACKTDHALLQHLREQLTNMGNRDTPDNLLEQIHQLRPLLDSLMNDREKSTEMISELQGAILQLQAECEKLHTTASTLMEEHNQKQKHIEHLYKSMEKLEEKKADRELVEMEIEIKADKRALESKVSRMQFDSMTEQLSSMFQDLLGKISGQEQDWHKVLNKISSEMECKLNRIELDSVKQQLEERWKAIRKQLQAQPGPELDDAAGIRRQLVSRFHCISCDRPVDMMTPGQNLLTVPSAPSLPSHKSSRPYTVYELEQVRQHCRSDHIPEMADYSYLAMSRSCGGSHTLTFPNRRYTRLQHISHIIQTEEETPVNTPLRIQPEEVDILGLDGHIYKGRLNKSVKTVEGRLPIISPGVSKSKDKLQCSPSQKSGGTLGSGRATPVRPQSAKTQRSRSTSSTSVRDRPVSSLVCLSQDPLHQASSLADLPGEVPPSLEVSLDLEPAEDLPVSGL